MRLISWYKEIFYVHLSRRLKCTYVIIRCLSSVVRPSSVVDIFSHFRLLLWNRWTEFNETWQETRSQCPLRSWCFFRADRKKQDGRPGLWLAETFWTSPLTPLNGIQQHLTGSKISKSSTKFFTLCFSGRLVYKNGRPGQSIKKVAHCTQVHVVWPFGASCFISEIDFLISRNNFWYLGHDSTLHFDPRVLILRIVTWVMDSKSQFHVELWARSRFHFELCMTPCYDTSLNYDRGHDSTLICNPGQDFTLVQNPTLHCGITQSEIWTLVKFWPIFIAHVHLNIPVELWLIKESKFNIQQISRVLFQRKIHWIWLRVAIQWRDPNFILHVHVHRHNWRVQHNNK